MRQDFRTRSRLGRTVFWSCVLILIWHGAILTARGQAKGADPLEIVPATLDFGRVNNAKSPLELSFKIHNRGNQSIEIAGVRSGCGCAAAHVEKSVLAPGGQLEVAVKVNIQGRQGNFSNHVMVDVTGREEPTLVRLQGTVIQDLWCPQFSIACIATGPGPVLEQNFEVRTVDWPEVRFNWSVLDKDLSVEELARTKDGDITVIKFRLSVKTPTAHTYKLLQLTPTDARINSLTIPVECRPYVARNVKRTASAAPESAPEQKPALRPTRVSLGVIPRGEERRFQLAGPAELLKTLRIAGLENVPERTKVHLEPPDERDKESLFLTVRVDESAPAGLLDGRLRLISADGREHTIELLAVVGPRKTSPAQAALPRTSAEKEPSKKPGD